MFNLNLGCDTQPPLQERDKYYEARFVQKDFGQNLPKFPSQPLVMLRLLELGYLIFVASWLIFTTGEESSCQWRKKSVEEKYSSPEIFWINMDKSIDRRRSLETHLNQVGWLHRRVRGLALDKDIYIPNDVRAYWDQYEAKIDTTEKLLPRNHPNYLTSYGGNVSYFLIGLVGRAKTNRLKELGCTASHLEAMRQAIYYNRSSSKYAIITEDDIFIPYDIDFHRLAESAPTRDFGILQLFNSNEESMQSIYSRYLKDRTRNLWMENKPMQAASFWSTCAYLINREIMKPIIDKIAYLSDNGMSDNTRKGRKAVVLDERSGNTVVHMKIIAGIKKPCRPKLTACCKPVPGTYSYEFQHAAPCFWAAKGFQADSFLYALNKTYVLSLPIITNGAGGNISTFHQDHVEFIHAAAFKRQRMIINQGIASALAAASAGSSVGRVGSSSGSVASSSAASSIASSRVGSKLASSSLSSHSSRVASSSSNGVLPAWISLACTQPLTLPSMNNFLTNKNFTCKYSFVKSKTREMIPMYWFEGSVSNSVSSGGSSSDGSLSSSSPSSVSSSNSVSNSSISSVNSVNNNNNNNNHHNMNYKNDYILNVIGREGRIIPTISSSSNTAATTQQIFFPADIRALWQPPPSPSPSQPDSSSSTAASSLATSPAATSAATFPAILSPSTASSSSSSTKSASASSSSAFCKYQSTDETIENSQALADLARSGYTAAVIGLCLPSTAATATGSSSHRNKAASASSSPTLPSFAQSTLQIQRLTNHLIAMHTAIYANLTNADYAIIFNEEDSILPFHIDFEQLAETVKQPSNIASFGILTFALKAAPSSSYATASSATYTNTSASTASAPSSSATSSHSKRKKQQQQNSYNLLLEKLWSKYLQNSTTATSLIPDQDQLPLSVLYHDRYWSQLPDKYYEYISSKVYLINRHVMKPILDKIIRKYNFPVTSKATNSPSSIYTIRLIAGQVNKGKTGSCYPTECCQGQQQQSSGSSKKKNKSKTKSSSTKFKEDDIVASFTSPCVAISSHYNSPHMAASSASFLEHYLWKLAPIMYTSNVPLVIEATYGPAGITFPSSSVASTATSAAAMAASTSAKQGGKGKGREAGSRAGSRSGSGGGSSELYQLTSSQQQLQQQKQMVNSMNQGHVPLPVYAKHACQDVKF